MKETNWIEKADKVIANTYKRFPVVFESGNGAVLQDVNGRQYVDFVAGIAVCNLGHADRGVAEALARQAKKLFHVSNLFYTTPQVELAEWLVDHSFAGRVFFCNSGAEANEAAIKLARKNFFDKGDLNRWRIVAMEQSFHGRTYATLSATGQKKVREGFEPILEGFDFVAFNDFTALQRHVSETTCAVLLEPVQGEGGVLCASPDYMKAVRRLCDETGTILIFDEIQTGIGRTGRLFGYEHYGVTPDIMTLAKALGNGLPIGAMLATEDIAGAFTQGSHASTFGGTPVITAAALEVVSRIEKDNIIDSCRTTGKYFEKQLNWLKDKHDVIEEVRGVGLLLGIRLNIPGAQIVEKCMEKGYLINCIQETILRFIPPLVITKEQIDGLINCLDNIFGELQKQE